MGKLQKKNDDAKDAIKGLTHEKQKVYSEVKKLKDCLKKVLDEKNESVGV